MQTDNDGSIPNEQPFRGGLRRRIRGGEQPREPGGKRDSGSGDDAAHNAPEGPGRRGAGRGAHGELCFPPTQDSGSPGEGVDSGEQIGGGRGRGGGHGQGGGHGRRGSGRGRARRGDIRTATLLLLAQEPMHGYQIMQEIAARTDDSWCPGPSAVYPTIAQLEDEGLITITRTGGQKLATLTEIGHQRVQELPPSASDLFDPVAGDMKSRHGLRKALDEVQTATRAVARTGSDDQIEAVHQTLAGARRTIYLILAEDGAATESIESPPTN